MSERLSAVLSGAGRRPPWTLVKAVLGLLVIYFVPFVIADYQLVLMTSAAGAAIAILGLNLLFGYTGQISVGHAAFFGIGAYGVGIVVSRYGWSYPVGMLLSMVVAFAAGLIVSVPASRLKGLYLALVTIAVGAVFPALIRRFSSFTNGDNGIFNLQWQPPGWTGLYGLPGQQIWAFWVSGVCLVVACLLMHNLVNSRVGRALRAVRDNEVAAASAGIPVATFKALSFATAGALGAFGGALATASLGVVTPAQFGLLQSIEFLVAMVIGGAATIRGSIIGGLVQAYLAYYTSQLVSGPISGVIFGGAIIVAVFIAPEGIDGLLVRCRRAVVRRLGGNRKGRPADPPDQPVASVTSDPSGADLRVGVLGRSRAQHECSARVESVFNREKNIVNKLARAWPD